MNIQFSPPDISKLEISEVTQALESGWITTGPKTKLFEQETDIPVFMLIGIGGTDQKPERLFIVPFTDIEDHFIPKPIAYKYEEDPNMQLHYIPELRKLK